MTTRIHSSVNHLKFYTYGDAFVIHSLFIYYKFHSHILCVCVCVEIVAKYLLKSYTIVCVK